MSNIVQALRKGYLGAGRCDTDGRREADLDDAAWAHNAGEASRRIGHKRQPGAVRGLAHAIA